LSAQDDEIEQCWLGVAKDDLCGIAMLFTDPHTYPRGGSRTPQDGNLGKSLGHSPVEPLVRGNGTYDSELCVV
jgi:hypothetical protein